MSDRPSGDPHYSHDHARGVPVVDAPVAIATHAADHDHVKRVIDAAAAEENAPTSSGWSPTAWRSSSSFDGSE